MTQEEKFEEAKRLYETANADQRYVLESLFPELAESEDERIRKELIRVFSNREKYVVNQSFGDINVSDILTWLERQGEQNPSWSEEDESKIRHLIAFLDTNPNSVIYSRPKEEWIAWLKSLRPQSQWKPSDEQMDALLVKIPIENSCNKVDNILRSLYSDLKKLK